MSLCGLGLSCEPLPCEHGKQLRKEQCHLCELKTQIMALTDMYKEISCMVAGCHEHKIRQIDENEKIFKRIDDVIRLFVEGDSTLENDVIRVERKIEKLEEILPRYDELHKEWMDRIEKLQNEFADFMQKSGLNNQKVPFKCPVCDGVGNWVLESIESIVNNGGSKNQYCISCDGKGIVWG